MPGGRTVLPAVATGRRTPFRLTAHILTLHTTAHLRMNHTHSLQSGQNGAADRREPTNRPFTAAQLFDRIVKIVASSRGDTGQ